MSVYAVLPEFKAEGGDRLRVTVAVSTNDGERGRYLQVGDAGVWLADADAAVLAEMLTSKESDDV